MCYQCSSTKKPVLGEVWHCCCDWFCLQLSFQVWAMSHLPRITRSLSLPAAKECNPPFQSLEEKRFFQPRSGHCVKEDLAAFLVPWNLPKGRHTGAWSEPKLVPQLLQRIGSVAGFGVEHALLNWKEMFAAMFFNFLWSFGEGMGDRTLFWNVPLLKAKKCFCGP